VDDEIEPGRAAQTSQWWGSSAVVPAMDELKTTITP